MEQQQHSSGLTDVQRDAIGYVGGAILAVCLVPQVAKVIITRSARDISVIWSLLYSTGLTLSLAYLILKDAPAAWIPIIFEIGGCLLVLALKLWFEHTAAGRRFSAAKQPSQQPSQQQRGGGDGLGLPGLPNGAQGAVGVMHAGKPAQQQQQQQQDGAAAAPAAALEIKCGDTSLASDSSVSLAQANSNAA